MLCVMRGTTLVGSGAILALMVGCGGSTPPPEEPVTTVEEPTEAPPPEPPMAEEPPEEEAPPPKAEVPEPEFKEGMSVEEAINAVPQGTARLNMETEVLSKPLMDAKVYEPCKPGSARFKVRVAVWDGKAVGMDVTVTPNNPRLAQCIKERIGELTWEDKVKSLNTIEYQF